MQLLRPRLSLKEKMFFAEHLAVMLKAGIALDKTLATLAEQAKSKSTRKILESIGNAVGQGQPLSQGLKEFEYTFGSLFLSMVAAGEYSGKLEEALKRLHQQMKKDYDLKSKVIGALIYPAFIIVAMIGIGAAMMIFVIPKLIPIFANFGTQLPLATRVLIFISQFVADWTLWIVIVLLVLGFIFAKVVVRGPGRKFWHTFLLRLPVIGALLRNVNIARTTRTFSTLLGTDIAVVEALSITSNMVGNVLFKQSLKHCAEEVKGGASIASVLKSYPKLFPPTVHTMAMVGEESGNLKGLLEEVAGFYEEQVDATTKNFSAVIEPVLIVLLGVAIGGIAIAILTPMYSLMEQI